MKKCLIRQPAGLGDIVFLQKIAKKLVKKGYEVHWPVIQPYEYVQDYMPYYNWHVLPYDHPDDDVNNHSIDFPLKEYYNPTLPVQCDNGDLFLP